MAPLPFDLLDCHVGLVFLLGHGFLPFRDSPGERPFPPAVCFLSPGQRFKDHLFTPRRLFPPFSFRDSFVGRSLGRMVRSTGPRFRTVAFGPFPFSVNVSPLLPLQASKVLPSCAYRFQAENVI